MALVRALIGDRSVNVSPEYAETHSLELLDEPTHLDDGRVRPETTATGRPIKPKVTVDALSAAKKAGQPTAKSTPPSSEEN